MALASLLLNSMSFVCVCVCVEGGVGDVTVIRQKYIDRRFYLFKIRGSNFSRSPTVYVRWEKTVAVNGLISRDRLSHILPSSQVHTQSYKKQPFLISFILDFNIQIRSGCYHFWSQCSFLYTLKTSGQSK